MKTIEFYLNVVHFCYYKAHYKSYLLFSKVNPFALIHKLPFQKKRYEKLGIDIRKELDRAVLDEKFGVSIIFSGGALLVLFFFFFFGIFSLIRKLFTTERLEAVHFVIFGVCSFLVFYFLVSGNNKYIKYFDQFEKWDKLEKLKYNWFTFIGSIFIFGFWILSF